MTIPYVMPKLAMAMNEGVVAEWLVSDGSYVNQGDPLASIETEKVSYDVESPESGYIQILIQAGDSAPCGDTIAMFHETSDAVSNTPSDTELPQADATNIAVVAPASSQSKPANSGGRIIASPLAKAIARDHGLSLLDLNGTGPHGRIVKRDVMTAIEKQEASPVSVNNEILATVPISGSRAVIAQRMLQSQAEAAQVSSHWESDVTELTQLRQKLVKREAEIGVRISMNTLIAKAIIYAVKQVPIMNACVGEEGIQIYKPVHLGIAISMPGVTQFDSALVVGVVKHADSCGIAELDNKIREVIQRIRSGNATAADMTGSTITMSSTAGIAPPGMTTSPVINRPNVAIVGPSTPMEKMWVVDGEPCVRTLMPMSFTFDHCAVDGEPASRFMAALNDALSNPELLLL